VYRHVEILNQHGIEAVVVHQEPGFRYPWDERRTPVSYVDEVKLSERDLVVVPDVSVGSIPDIDPSVPVAVFSQNAYLTPWERPGRRHEPTNPYRAPNVVGIVTTNSDNLRYLARAFPHLDVRRLYLTVSEAMRPDALPKEQLVSYMPRKNPADAARVVASLRARGAFEGLDVIAIQACTHAETADILARSSVFLSFGHPEGWALPPAEAMASGCVVVGYHGRGGREYWAPGCTHPVEFGDLDGYERTAEGVLRELRLRPAAVHASGREAAAFIRATYPAGQQDRSVVDTWSWMVRRAAAHRLRRVS
jgi:glycosyltransferase involved in cell wall biosynthesis